MNQVCGLDRAGDDAFELCVANLRGERLGHGVPGFADRDDEHAPVGVEVVEIFADAQDAALAVHVASERSRNAGFSERVLEDLARCVAHGGEEGGIGHKVDYRKRHSCGVEYPLDYSVIESHSRANPCFLLTTTNPYANCG